MPDSHILVINAGSSSIKTALFDDHLTEVLRVEATGVGGTGTVKIGSTTRTADLPDNAAALAAIFDALSQQGIAVTSLRAAAHRVVHGGITLTAPCRITPAIRQAIADCIPLAPLHNPHHLAAIDAVAGLAPYLPQCASFDTAFHATIPDIARRYALPDRADLTDLKRYGFHGTSYAALVRALPQQSGTLPKRLLACHLGNGASLCAILDGQSVATTMGYSPLSGLTMGTRVGEIDAGAVLRLVRQLGLDETETLLHHQSGLLGLSGISSDMRSLENRDTPKARFAIDHFCYWAARQAGSMIAAMGGLDAVAFTGGIGENSARIRNGILDKLSWMGNFPSYTVAAQEEIQIAREASALLNA
ncbi:MAG: acetate kinase [Sulfitobacter sp.]|nr:acetate kinase [Sulfitobacter sp.]